MKGYLYLFSEQGIPPCASIYDDSIGGYNGTFIIEKKTYNVKISNSERVVYEGSWTYSRKNSSINGFYSPKEISAKEWKKMFLTKHQVSFREVELDMSDLVVKSFLDTDLYKLTMGQFVYFNKKKQFASHKLHIRCHTDLSFLKDDLEKQIKLLKHLRFTSEEIDYLKKSKYLKGIFKEEYLRFLQNFTFQGVLFKLNNEDNLSVEISGSWEDTILAEVIISSTINELYFKSKNPNKNESLNLMRNEINKVKGTNLKFIEMGTRRRFSFSWHKEILSLLKKEIPNNLIGTSNVLLAKEFNLKPVGTMAHELFQGFQVLGSSFETSQKEALYSWSNFYKDKLNVALTDIFNTDTFLADCDKGLLNRYKGYRQDSGDPILWGNKMLTHFHENGVNAKEKDLVFSDSLNFDKALNIYNEFQERTNVVFGIGTFLTNNLVNNKALKIVIKLNTMNGDETIKVSDDKGKISSKNKELVDKALNLINNVKRYPSINISVDAIIKNDDKVLIIKRSNKNEEGYEKWALVGGFIDYSESAKKAVLREVFEEVGLELKDPSFLNYYDDFNRDNRKRNISLVFEMKFKGSVNINKEEVSGFKWVSKKDFKNHNYAFDHKKILEDYFIQL